MHGVKRDRNQQSEDIRGQRKAKESQKIQLYKTIEDQFFLIKQSNAVNIEALEVTGQLLRFNPELYTAWNYRRKVLVNLFEDNEDFAEAGTKKQPKGDFFASLQVKEIDNVEKTIVKSSQRAAGNCALLEEDLDLTIELLKNHPKVYWIWNHRKWCLQQLPSKDERGVTKWATEIRMVNKMLDMDSRNFHGWNYRRFILTHLALPQDTAVLDLPDFPTSLTESLSEDIKKYQMDLAMKELQYTTSKIESNFSNFSAWHHRSLLLVPMWTARGLNEQQRRQERDTEFELIRQAIFVDPEDQSVWTYHSWLIELDPAADVLQREIASLRELLELEPDSKWCMISLAEYLFMLAYHLQEKEAKAKIGNESKKLLQKLIEIDSDRKHRYQNSIKYAFDDLN